MSKVQKIKNRRKNEESNNSNSITRLAFILIVLASGIMMSIGLRNLYTDWGAFALFQSMLCLFGYTGYCIIQNKKIIPMEFAPVDFETAFRTLIIFIAAIVTQFITQYTLSISNTEQALYYVFASVCEEVFFRLFLISTVLKLFDTIYIKLTAVFFQAVLFAAFHVNYYNDLAALAGVLIGGIILGFFYVYYNDITANIMAHFILNMIAAMQFLVTL